MSLFMGDSASSLGRVLRYFVTKTYIYFGFVRHIYICLFESFTNIHTSCRNTLI